MGGGAWHIRIDVEEEMLHVRFERMVVDQQRGQHGQRIVSNIPQERVDVSNMPARQHDSTTVEEEVVATTLAIIGPELSTEKENEKSRWKKTVKKKRMRRRSRKKKRMTMKIF